jgi:hypothetical protein
MHGASSDFMALVVGRPWVAVGALVVRRLSVAAAEEMVPVSPEPPQE